MKGVISLKLKELMDKYAITEDEIVRSFLITDWMCENLLCKECPRYSEIYDCCIRDKHVEDKYTITNTQERLKNFYPTTYKHMIIIYVKHKGGGD